jgi:type II secretory pathway pseudopilin PulG
VSLAENFEIRDSLFDIRYSNFACDPMTDKTKTSLKAVAIAFPLLALVATFSFPFFGRTTDKARATDALITAVQLQQAVTVYFTEYSRYPVPQSLSFTGQNTSLHSDSELMDFLIYETEHSPGLSPRKISFYEGREATNGRRGIVTHSDGTHQLVDPWGNHYRVIMDTNRDDQVIPPSWSGGKEPIPRSVLVWSPGPDGKDETAGDNVTSW